MWTASKQKKKKICYLLRCHARKSGVYKVLKRFKKTFSAFPRVRSTLCNGYVSTRLNFSASVFRSFSLSLGDTCNPMKLFPLAATSQKQKNSACARAADLQNTKHRSWIMQLLCLVVYVFLWSCFHYTVSTAAASVAFTHW